MNFKFLLNLLATFTLSLFRMGGTVAVQTGDGGKHLMDNQGRARHLARMKYWFSGSHLMRRLPCPHLSLSASIS